LNLSCYCIRIFNVAFVLLLSFIHSSHLLRCSYISQRIPINLITYIFLWLLSSFLILLPLDLSQLILNVSLSLAQSTVLHFYPHQRFHTS
jgi:hypothetical protein